MRWLSTMSSRLKQIISTYPYPDKLRIKDVRRVSDIVEALIVKGPSALQVITDFDHCLTKSHFPDGTPASTGPGVMNTSPLLPQDFKNKVTELVKKYRPIEFDHTLPVEQKIPLMVEWYQKRKEAVIEARIKKGMIEEMVATCKVALRDGAPEALKMLNAHDVPVLIFSAGNGDIIEAVMRKHDALLPNAHVISNFYKYNEEGYIVDYKSSTLLHVFNKNEHAVENCSYFDDLSHRPNAIVLGDHLADEGMSDGMPDPSAILKIGFLNELTPSEDTLKVYEETFDVVLLDDQTFEFVNILLCSILGNPRL